MCRTLYLLCAYSLLHCLDGRGVYARSIQKRQTQGQVQLEATVNTGGLLNLASNLHNLAGNIVSQVKKSVENNGGQFQFGGQFGINGQGQGFGGPYGRPPFGPPPGQYYGGYPPPPPPPHHHHHHGHHGHHHDRPGYGPPPDGPPHGGRPPYRPPYPYEGYPPHGHQHGRPPNGLPNEMFGSSEELNESQEEDEDRKVISGYIDGNFPVILLEENEIR